MDEPLKEDVKLTPEPSAEVIPQDVKPEAEEVETTEEVIPTPPTPPKGYVPQAALNEERRHIELLEEELKQIKESSVSSEQLAELPDYDFMTDTEKYLAKELIQLKEKSKWEEDLAKVKKTFPELGNKEAEFKDYCYKYPKSVDVEILAESFLFKNRIKPTPETVNTNQGLEKPTGGSKQVSTPGLTLEEVTRLRESQPRLYEKMIREGKLPKKLPEK